MEIKSYFTPTWIPLKNTGISHFPKPTTNQNWGKPKKVGTFVRSKPPDFLGVEFGFLDMRGHYPPVI